VRTMIEPSHVPSVPAALANSGGACSVQKFPCFPPFSHARPRRPRERKMWPRASSFSSATWESQGRGRGHPFYIWLGQDLRHDGQMATPEKAAILTIAKFVNSSRALLQSVFFQPADQRAAGQSVRLWDLVEPRK